MPPEQASSSISSSLPKTTDPERSFGMPQEVAALEPIRITFIIIYAIIVLTVFGNTLPSLFTTLALINYISQSDVAHNDHVLCSRGG